MSEAKGSGSKRRFRATSIIIAVAVVCLMMGSSLGIIIPSSSTNASAQSVTSTPFTYEAYTGSFPSDDVPTHYQAAVGTFTTDWGKAALGSTFSTIGALWIGAVSIPCWLSMYDASIDYWYYNTSLGGTGRPFSSLWSDWYMLRNDTNVGIFERYAEAPHAYSGSTKEFNVTVRIAILKHDPVIKIDSWLRILNATSLVAKIDFNPIMYDLGSAGATESKDVPRGMGCRNTTTWALGVIGSKATVTNGGNSYTGFDKYPMNRTTLRPSESLHAPVVFVIGANVTSIQALADKIGDSWQPYEAVADRNFVIANNTNKYDALDYFPSTGYTVYPSGTTEKVYALNLTTTLTLQPNPILNYAKIPFVTFIDDHVFAVGENASWTWAYAKAREYGIPFTLPSSFDDTILPHEIYSWVNLSNEQHGTLFEIAEHNYNHTSFFGYQGYDYQRATVNLSMDKWYAYTTIPLQSNALAGNAWSYNTWDALGSTGIRNLRLSTFANEWQSPRDYNLTGSPVWVTAFQSLIINADPIPDTLRSMNNTGFWIHQGHMTEFDTGGEQTTVEAYWSWVQNQTAILPVTFSQFSDLWHHRIVVSDMSGVTEINMTTCQSNHLLRLNAAPGSFWYDVTNSSLVPFEINATVMTMIGEQGHVYRELPIQIVATGPAVVNPISYLPTPETVASWSVIGTAGSTATFTLTGVVTGTTYKVYVDSAVMATLLAVGSQITFDFSAWSTHVFSVVIPETFVPSDDALVIPSERSPSSSTAGTTSFTWTSPGMIVVVSFSILIALLLLLRRPRGRSGTRHI